MPKIELKNIELKYFGKTALKIDALDFDSCLGVIGESGSGKTNLIKVLTGLEYIESGQIFFDGIDITQIKTSKRGIVLLSAQTPLFGRKSVQYNLEFPLKQRKKINRHCGQSAANRRISKDEIAERVEKRAGEFCLPLEVRAKDLTEEQKIDALLARAFIRRSNLIIVDEPHGFTGNTEYFCRRFNEFIQKYGACVVFSTYDYNLVKDICDKFIVLNDGTVAAQGTREEIENSPDDYVKAGCGFKL